jgi:hypothetical protein
VEPSHHGPYYLMLNGASPCGMEILPLALLFGLPRHGKQRPRFFFWLPGVENGAPGDQQVGPSVDD